MKLYPLGTLVKSHWSEVLSGRCPSPGQVRLPRQDRTGVPPDQDGGTPPPQERTIERALVWRADFLVITLYSVRLFRFPLVFLRKVLHGLWIHDIISANSHVFHNKQISTEIKCNFENYHNINFEGKGFLFFQYLLDCVYFIK